jgi:hypothetical protein
MKHIDANSSFEQWVADVFDRPPGASCVCRTDSDHVFDEAATALEWRSRLFREAGTRLRGYTDDQVAQGLDHLSSHAHSDDMLALADPSVPAEVRSHCLESFVPLFRDVFRVRCVAALTHGAAIRGERLNGVCFMWWDAMDYYPGPADPGRRPVDLVAVRVMGQLLDLDSIACKESAVHGLGHWRWKYPEAVEPLLDVAIANARDWPPGLLEYAQQARWREVL